MEGTFFGTLTWVGQVSVEDQREIQRKMDGTLRDYGYEVTQSERSSKGLEIEFETGVTTAEENVKRDWTEAYNKLSPHQKNITQDGGVVLI